MENFDEIWKGTMSSTFNEANVTEDSISNGLSEDHAMAFADVANLTQDEVYEKYKKGEL